jgi:hypothetical protein
VSEQTTARAPAPTARDLRELIERLGELWLGSMFLKAEAYAYLRDRKNPFGNGLVYIAVIGVITALAAIVGAGLRYATSPSVDALKNTVLIHLQAMPFYSQLSPAIQSAFDQGFQQNWDQFGSIYVGYPINTAGFVQLLLGVVTTPLGLIIIWLIYGALIHLVGRRWNPETSLSELLAPLALATSPQLLRVLEIFPGVSLAGPVITLWVLICNITAVKIAYQTTTRRAVWGALFPALLLLVLVVILVVLGVMIFTLSLRSAG